jgi:carboxylesterase type B
MMSHRPSKPALFHRAIIESGAATSRAVRPYNAAIHEQQFRDFLAATGCPKDLAKPEIFPFLRALPSKVVTDAQISIFDKYNPSLAWAFQPVIDGDIIPRPPLETWALGATMKIPLMTGFNGNEGSLYVSKKMAQPADFTSFWRKLLPLFSDDDIQTIDAMYPDPDSDPDSPYKETRQGAGGQYKRIEAAYAHYAYVAPVRQTAHLASSTQDAPVYLYHWALVTSLLGGAQHGDNMRYETVNPAVIGLSEAQKVLAETVHAYVTSFITRGDPNALHGRRADRAVWEAYDGLNPKALVFGGGNTELIGGGTGTPAALEPDDWARKECEWWWTKVELSQQ